MFITKKNKNINNIDEESHGTLAFLSSTSHMFTLMIKNHFRGSSFWLGNLFIPIIITLALAILFPIWYSFIWMLFINLTLTAFITYGILFFTVRKSTIMKNIDMLSTETGSLYVSTFFTILLNTFITFVVFFTFLIILYFSGIASIAFFYDVGNPEREQLVNWRNIWWNAIVYYWFTSGVITFAISFVIEKIVSTQKNFFLISFIYLLGGLFFSGIVSEGIQIVDGVPRVVTVDMFLNDHSSIEDPTALFITYLWGKPAWMISQLWPHYGLNQITFASINAGSYASTGTGFAWNGVSFWDQLDDQKVEFYVIMPWLYSVLGYWVGGLLVRFDLAKT